MQDYVVIDLEMTGLNAKTDHILEVGAVRVRNHQAVDKFGAILCQNVKIPEKVTELTGITEAMVQGGMEKEEAMRQFFEFIGEDIIVGQNVIFDYGFLKQWAVNHNMPLERNAVDTLKLARKFLPKEQKKDLESLWKESVYYEYVYKSGVPEKRDCLSHTGNSGGGCKEQRN